MTQEFALRSIASMHGEPKSPPVETKVRLLILNQYALPRGASGITRHGDLGAALVTRGHDVRIIASRFNYLTRRSGEAVAKGEEVIAGVRFRWLDTGTYTRNDRGRVRSMIAFVLGSVVVGVRSSSRPDVVLASSPHLFTGIAGVVIAWRHRVPFVLEVRDFWPSVLVDLGAVRRGSVMHRILEGLERWLYRRAKLIIFVPPRGERRLTELGIHGTRSVHIPNGADLSGVAEPIPDSLASLLADLEGRYILMYTGAHGVANDLGTLLTAMDELKALAPDIHARTSLVLIGDGSEKAAISERIAKDGSQSIRLHPPISKAAIPSALAAADVLIVNVAPAIAHSYGLSPNKLFDYMAAGRPVLISSHVPTIADEVGAGLRYEPGDAKGLAHCIASLLSGAPAEREVMGARGKMAVEREHALEMVASRLEQSLAGELKT